MFADNDEFANEQHYAQTPLIRREQIRENNYDPKSQSDREFLAQLIRKRYNTSIQSAGIALTDEEVIRRIAHDITSAIMHNDPIGFTDQLRLTYSIIESTIVDLRRLQNNLDKARPFRDTPSFWKKISQRITLPTYAIPTANLCLHLLTLIFIAINMLQVPICKNH